MTLSTTKVFNIIQWLLTVFLVASFLVFDGYTWGKYSFIACAVLILLMTVFKNFGRIRLHLEPFYVLFAAFTAYVALTAIWAAEPSQTLTMARTLLRILICYTLVYWAYMYDDDPTRLLTAITFSSYVVAFYTVTVIGYDKIIHTSDDILMDSTYANINSISLFLAFGCICDLYLALFHRFRIYSLLSVFSVVVIASMRTRKSIVFLVLGVLGLLLLRFSNSKSAAYRVLKIITILAFVLVGVYFLAKLPIFSEVNERLEYMLNTFTGTGKSDYSSVIRARLIRVGIFCWSKHPIIGVGMNNTQIYTANYLFFKGYLHNNYVELLAGGGIIAFLLYYAMYGYLIYGFIKIRKTQYAWYAFGIIMITLLLITDFGRVSYYSKPVYFELMTLFLIVRITKDNRKDLTDHEEALKIPA